VGSYSEESIKANLLQKARKNDEKDEEDFEGDEPFEVKK
jgi:hypothetical protein